MTKRSIQWLVSAPENKNLANDLSAEELGSLAQDVLRSYDIDRANRAEWDAQSERALKLAKQILEKKSTPWEGAANVKYPLITVATIQFAARAYPEICKGQRIVKCQITGDDRKSTTPSLPPMAGLPSPTGPQAGLPGTPPGPPQANMMMPAQQAGPDPRSLMAAQGQGMSPQGPQPGSPPAPLPESPKQQRANRISVHMNWQLTQEMSDWEADTDCMLHVLPVVGQCYKKTYFSSQDRHNISELVLPDDCVVSKGRSRDLKKARRITHRLWIYTNEAIEKMRSGVWLDVDLGTAPSTDSDTDAPHEFYEQHRWDDLDGDGYKEPYIVTVHKTTSQVVRVVARWIPDGIEIGDNRKLVRIKPDHYFTHFGFIPNPDGSINYLGFGQLLEAINASANTALNQLLDSGTLANAGGGFIGKGVRLRGGQWNFRPGEWKLVDAHGAALKENIVPLPAKEPSVVLFQLLGFLVQAGKDISSLQDILAGDAKLASNMPVGTIMALVEQGLKVFTGIYKRVYRSLSEEFKKMYDLNARFLEPEVSFYISGQSEQYVRQSDYIQGDTMVMPVADPELSSDMQRVLKSQALKELSGRPGLNEVEMTRRLVKAVRPENVDDLLLTDGQLSGNEPTPWSPPPTPQQVLAQAKAQRMMQQAQEAQVRLQMDMLKFKLELQEIEERISNVKADTMLKLAKTEDTGQHVYLEYYKTEVQRLAKETEMKLAGIKGAVDKFAGASMPEGGPVEPTGMEPPAGAMMLPEAGGMPMIPGRAEGGPVMAGQPYMVGEDGHEVFVPTAGGGPTEAGNPTQGLMASPGTIGQSGNSKGGTVITVPKALEDMWSSARKPTMEAAQTIDAVLAWPFGKVAGPGLAETATGALFPESPKEAIVGGVANLQPAVIQANFRAPEVIQGLRKVMAEEMKARGPATRVYDKSASPYSPEFPEKYPNLNYGTDPTIPTETPLVTTTDPVEQVLRGGWYHGLSGKARAAQGVPESVMYDRNEVLKPIFDTGFPVSHHDAQSISNKLGEPSGVSLSMLPTKSQQFSADEYVHRVLPVYGGPPKERVVNLMTTEGRKELNDAYDVVVNNLLAENKGDILGTLAKNLESIKHTPASFLPETAAAEINDLPRMFSEYVGVGKFNQALSQELQRRGKRALLYNPKRWDEYEMLVLDPKYAMPLDYRKMQEYAHPVKERLAKSGPGYKGYLDTQTATPGTRKGLVQLEETMAQNKSRLGDIYSERPWVERLSKENKERLLEMIDPQYQEVVRRQLYKEAGDISIKTKPKHKINIGDAIDEALKKGFEAD